MAENKQIDVAKAEKMMKKRIERMILGIHRIRTFIPYISKASPYFFALLVVFLVCYTPAFLNHYSTLKVVVFSPVVLIPLAAWGIVLLRKKLIIGKFMQVADISDCICYVDGSDTEVFERLLQEKTWVFGSKKEELLPFLYNWLRSGGMLQQNQQLNVYMLSINDIKTRYPMKETANLSGDLSELFCISITELALDPRQDDQLAKESKVVKPYRLLEWVSDHFVFKN